MSAPDPLAQLRTLAEEWQTEDMTDPIGVPWPVAEALLRKAGSDLRAALADAERALNDRLDDVREQIAKEIEARYRRPLMTDPLGMAEAPWRLGLWAALHIVRGDSEEADMDAARTLLAEQRARKPEPSPPAREREAEKRGAVRALREAAIAVEKRRLARRGRWLRSRRWPAIKEVAWSQGMWDAGRVIRDRADQIGRKQE